MIDISISTINGPSVKGKAMNRIYAASALALTAALLGGIGVSILLGRANQGDDLFAQCRATQVAGDINGDCVVDAADMQFIADWWLGCYRTVDLPRLPRCLSPRDGAIDVSTSVTPAWRAGIGATSHDVYFGTSSPGGFQGNQGETTFYPGPLSQETTYFWRIDEVNSRGTTTGPVWTFTTGGGR